MNKRRTDVCPYQREGVCSRVCQGFQCLEKEDIGKPYAPFQSNYQLETVRIHSELKTQLAWIELLVLRTPTGQRRNELTDSAIHLRESISRLQGLI